MSGSYLWIWHFWGVKILSLQRIDACKHHLLAAEYILYVYWNIHKVKRIPRRATYISGTLHMHNSQNNVIIHWNAGIRCKTKFCLFIRRMLYMWMHGIYLFGYQTTIYLYYIPMIFWNGSADSLEIIELEITSGIAFRQPPAATAYFSRRIRIGCWNAENYEHTQIGQGCPALYHRCRQSVSPVYLRCQKILLICCIVACGTARGKVGTYNKKKLCRETNS